jgi:phytoene dehydrogenase-like protein
MTSVTSADVVIVGAGHNSLVAAAYLARGGRKVLVLEARELAGGRLSGATPDAPGLHPAGHLRPDIVRDLGLAQHGLVDSQADVPYVIPLDDGSALALSSHPSDAATLDALRRLSPTDASRWPEFVAFMNAAAGFLDATYATSMPRLPKVDWRTEGWPLATLAWKLRKLGARHMFGVIRSVSMSAIEFTEEWFESEPLKAAIGALAVHGQTIGSMSAGGGLVLVHEWLNRGGLAHRGVAGGTANLRDALVACVKARGGDIRTSNPVAQILVDCQRVTGVRLATGEEIRAPLVVSGADPRRTLLGLVGAVELPPEFVWHTGAIRMRGSVAKVHVTTDGRHGLPPGTIAIAPTLRYLERAYDAAKYGQVSEQPYLEVTSDGPRVMIHYQFAPYALRQGDWTSARAPVESRALATLSERFPSFRASVQSVQSLIPPDLEREWGLTEGDLNHGQLILDQVLFMRPMPGWSNHRTPIDGLYLCGSGGHGGGGVSGAPGRNAAREILRG